MASKHRHSFHSLPALSALLLLLCTVQALTSSHVTDALADGDAGRDSCPPQPRPCQRCSAKDGHPDAAQDAAGNQRRGSGGASSQ